MHSTPLHSNVITLVLILKFLGCIQERIAIRPCVKFTIGQIQFTLHTHFKLSMI
ncbi:hypothetical protein [Moraxella lacunata]|uniref:hypothetical protein n=1 Tax=Moraxella lacunata TaxID=477 RepID=UPI003EDEEC89